MGAIKYFHINFVLKMFGSSLHPFMKLSVSTVVIMWLTGIKDISLFLFFFFLR